MNIFVYKMFCHFDPGIYKCVQCSRRNPIMTHLNRMSLKFIHCYVSIYNRMIYLYIRRELIALTNVFFSEPHITWRCTSGGSEHKTNLHIQYIVCIYRARSITKTMRYKSLLKRMLTEARNRILHARVYDFIQAHRTQL